MSLVSRCRTLQRTSLRAGLRFNSTTAATEAPKLPRWRRFARTAKRFTIVSTVLGVGAFSFFLYQDQHPPEQLPPDPEKPTIIVLGSGWGATSLLKSLDTEAYNVLVISPKNYFLFTPLLPSVAVGTLGRRSVMQGTRYVTRFKKRGVGVVEAEAESVDPVNKTVTFVDTSPIQGETSKTTYKYDYLVCAVGAEVQTFGIPGVKEHACFMKELPDAEKTQQILMDCIESAAFPGQSEEEKSRLLHFVVVGGGPTGIELSGEIHDFLEEDLRRWYPELANQIRITLIEALPSVLPMFSKQLINYTESTFKQSKIDIHTGTMVKEVKPRSVVLQLPDKTIKEVPVGMVVWAGGNKLRAVTQDLMNKIGPTVQTNKRGITVDDHLRMAGTDSIFAIGDCTATSYAPTAQVAQQQGRYLARFFAQTAKKRTLEEKLKDVDTQLMVKAAPELETEKNSLLGQLDKIKIRPFHYSHQGSLAYIGSDKAIADLPFFNGNLATGGVATFLFWRSAYISNLFSIRNRTLVATDWLKTKVFGRDVSRDI